MKLTTKISAAAVGLLLLFSQIFSVWNLARTQDMRLGSVINSEAERLNTAVERFFESYSSSHRYIKNENGRRFWGRSEFQRGFGKDAVLYYKDQELSNNTPYEFDLAYFRQHAGSFEKLRRYIPDQTMLWYRTTLLMVGETGGSIMLILYSEIQETDFGILHYRDVTAVFEESRQLFVQGILTAFILALFLVLALTMLVRRILRPFYRLRDAAVRIAGGDFSGRIEDPGRDEIGEVARSFNDMARQVEEYVRSLAGTNEKQRRLLGALAHELKTPMTGIQGYAELLQRVELPAARQQAALGYIEQECKRLSRLSAKLLQLMELSGEGQPVTKKEDKAEKPETKRQENYGAEAGTKSDSGAAMKQLEVRKLFTDAEQIAGHRIREKGLRFEIHIEENAGTIEGDEDLLLSFLTNLIDNAAKASAPGSTIWLTASEEGIFVCDEGEGIPEEELGKITEPFYMADKSRSRQEGGAGLGLALCEQIARLHGGKLQITSKPGKGTKAGMKVYNLLTS